MSDKRRERAIARARKLASYEDDNSVTGPEREAFTKQLDALCKRWNITNDELFPPEDEPEPEYQSGSDGRPSVSDLLPNIPTAKAKPAPKAKPNTGGAVDGAEALDYLGDILGEFFK
jgi:hypothetical protein